MAYSFVTYTGDGTTKDFTYNLGYVSKSHVTVKVGGVTQTLPAQYIWLSDTVVRFVTAPTTGAVIYISRSTSPSSRLVTYETGTSLTKTVLENDSKQAFLLMQEALDGQSVFMNIDSADNKWNANSKIIKNGATPTATADLTTKGYVDTAISTQITAIGAGNVAGPGSSTAGNVVTWNNANGTLVADSGVSLTNYVTGTGTLTAGNLVKANANRVIEDAGVATSNIVTAGTAAIATNQVALSDAASKSVKFLTNGSNGQALVISGGIPTWGSGGAVVLLGTSAATAATVTFTLLSDAYVAYRLVSTNLVHAATPNTTVTVTLTGVANWHSNYLTVAGSTVTGGYNNGIAEALVWTGANDGQCDISFTGQSSGRWEIAGWYFMRTGGSRQVLGSTSVSYSPTVLSIAYSTSPASGTFYLYGVRAS